MANRFFYSNNTDNKDGTIEQSNLLSYYDSLIFDERHRTIWHAGMPYGNVYPGTQSYGEVFNDIDNNVAVGAYTHAEGFKTHAYESTFASHVEGAETWTKATYSHTEGRNTYITSEEGGHAEGNQSYVSGRYGHAEGFKTHASGNYSHSEGNTSISSGNYAHAEGKSVASGENSHSEGENTKATGQASHAEGSLTSSSGNYSHAEGSSSIASGNYSHAEGKSTSSNIYAHSEGQNTVASGQNAHSEGESTKASGKDAHTEGYDNESAGVASHAEGSSNYVGGANSHVEGEGNTTYTNISHIEGSFNKVGTLDAPGDKGVHVEGSQNTVFGRFTHVEGTYNYVGLSDTPDHHSHIIGAYNSSYGTYNFVSGLRNLVYGFVSHVEGSNNYVGNSGSHISGLHSKSYGGVSLVHGEFNLTSESSECAVVLGTLSTAYGEPSISLGGGIISYNDGEVAVGRFNQSIGTSFEGQTQNGAKVSIFEVGVGQDVDHRKNAITVFDDSTTYFGGDVYMYDGNTYVNIYNSSDSILEQTVGRWNKTFTYAEYFNDYANNLAGANYAHAEGFYTSATGEASHAGGWYTQANNRGETAIGCYNASGSNMLFSIGNGTSTSVRKNALSIYSNGNALLFDHPIVKSSITDDTAITYLWKGSLDEYKAKYQGDTYSGNTIYFIDDGSVEGTSLPSSNDITQMQNDIAKLYAELKNCVKRYDTNTSKYLWTGSLSDFNKLKTSYNGNLPEDTTFVINP